MERRRTIQKSLVLDAINALHSHVTADEVYDYISKSHPSIGKGTVYRNLNILVDEKKVRKIEISNGSDRYDFTLENHYHVQCIDCGNVYDVDMDEVNLIHCIHDEHNFKFIDFDILFKGICPSCQNKH